ncbi:MAG TPA: sulfate adenylyltransferase subunit CysN [Bryobacteraceae bacterium]|nr:sulfate adenylyltransferase subunit CysN [Bryobacteraceae bacterium]
MTAAGSRPDFVAGDGFFDIQAFLDQEASKDLLRLTTAGSVDDGKSTLIGRMLHDARGAYDDQLRSARRGGEIDFSLLTDGLRAEREQGITIDVAYRYFSTPKRKFILADTPGHEQYTRNMATGASTAELAIILCDASRGLTVQSRRHAYIAALLGIPHFVIAVNKMDLAGYREEVFRQIRSEFEPFLHRVGAKDPYFLPISALKGDNVVEPSRNMGWFRGPSLLEHLETVETQNRAVEAPFRMAVQRVVRPNQDFRGYAGQIASGVIRPGDEVVALPSGRRTRVRRIATFDGDLKAAHAPLSVTLTLEDEIDISRGDMIAAGEDPLTARSFEAAMVWFDGKPLDPGRDYLVKQTSQVAPARVEAVKHKVNVSTLEIGPAPDGLWMNEIGVVRIACARPLFFDKYAANRGTGSFILIDRETNATAGAGMIVSAVEDIVENAADRVARLVRALIPAGARVDLPEDDAAAAGILRGRLKGLWND